MSAQAISRGILVLGLGFAAGMQLGKIAPLIGRMQAEFGFSLTFIGWLASLLGLFVALAAYPATRFVARRGTARSLKAGAVAMIAGAIALGLSRSAELMIVSRGIEAIGYVLLVIAAPANLATHSPSHLRGVFLALWGGFVPIGYALANLQAAALPEEWPSSWVMLTFAFPIALSSVLMAVTLPTEMDTGAKAAKRRPIPLIGWVLATAFGLYVYLSIGFFTFLPEYRASHSAGDVMFPAAVALCVPLGNVLAAILLRGSGASRARPLALIGFISAGVAAAMLYSSWPLDAIVMPLFALAGGMTASGLFAQVPRLAANETAAASIIGAMAQAGGLSTLLEPPLAGFLAETYGWAALGWSLTTVALTGAALNILFHAAR